MINSGFNGPEPNSHRGATNTWLTPRNIIDALGPFDLDPCAAPEPRPWPTAWLHYTEEQDGLTRPWTGFVWCNPPYGEHTGTWLNKLADHMGGGIALVFARTETTWFQSIAKRASLFLFPRKRITFCRPDGSVAASNAGAPSVFIGFGSEAKVRLLESGIEGFYTTPFHP